MKYDEVPAFTLAPTPTPTARARAETAAPRTPRFIDDVAAGRVELPTIPQVVQQVMAALRDAHVDARTVGRTLARDPVLTAKVLRLANSSFFGGQRSIASIDAAVALIGTAALNRLIVACGVSSSFGKVPGIDLARFWRDARVAATAAHRLAPHLAADAEEAYLCGLLHGTGHLILCRSYPEIADAMFTGFPPVHGAELAAVELECFGIDHPTVGALWAESIGFPPTVAATIGTSTRPPAAIGTAAELALHGACTLAAAVARRDDVETALAALHDRLRVRFTTPGGEPAPAFAALYGGLGESEPSA